MFDTDLINAMIRAKLPEADFVRVTPCLPDDGEDPADYEGLFICETETPDHLCNANPRSYVVDMADMTMRRINGREIIYLEA